MGFEGLKRWTLTGRSDEVPFLRLSSRDDLNITFVVMKPAGFIANYQPELHTVDVTVLELAGPHEACVLNIVTLNPSGHATVNLKGPLVINRRTCLGKQVVLVNAASYGVQYQLPAPN